MMSISFESLVWCLPLMHLAPAIGAGLTRPEKAWRIAETAAAAAIALPAAALAFATRHGDAGRADDIGLMMAELIAFLGWVILRFSRRYLRGEAGQARYITAMSLTMASVSTVAISDSLGIIAVAWMASSLFLHHLLTFYRHRRGAQIVAHKKFLASRLADFCVIIALALLKRGAGTLSLAELTRHLATMSELPATVHAAMALVALAVILKSAQLPVHGWLIQVMEAPTPVSALLHAGIVNIGGFILIRLAGPIAAAPLAQAMLVTAGGLSALLASLVMMTRISIKVRLAWSTCAQMGFMLLECGLGLYDLAFLHLLAHSLYKAHAFLGAGDAVLDTRRTLMLPSDDSASSARKMLSKLAAAPIAAAVVLGAVWLWRLAIPTLAMPPAMMLIVSLGLAPLLWLEEGWHGSTVVGLGKIFVLAHIYMAWHFAVGTLMPVPESPPGVVSAIWVSICFLALYLAQVWLGTRPHTAFSTTLFDWAYHGFYLDERFTRLTFKVWPVRFPEPALASLSAPSEPGKPA